MKTSAKKPKPESPKKCAICEKTIQGDKWVQYQRAVGEAIFAHLDCYKASWGIPAAAEPTTPTKPQKAAREGAGRPTTYSLEMAERICEEVANQVPIHQLAGKDGFPAERTIYGWLDAQPGFQQIYTRARERAADRFAADVTRHAAEASHPGADVARVRVDAAKWTAGKFAPKKYGDRIQHDIGLPPGFLEKANKEQLEAIANGKPIPGL